MHLPVKNKKICEHLCHLRHLRSKITGNSSFSSQAKFGSFSSPVRKENPAHSPSF